MCTPSRNGNCPPVFRVAQWRSMRVGVLGLITTMAVAILSAALAAEAPRALRLASEPVAFHTRDIDYLQLDGKTFQATIYQPEGTGPFPALLDVHGGAWVREDVRRDEHALMDRALAAMGMVVVAVDFPQRRQHPYPHPLPHITFPLP